MKRCSKCGLEKSLTEFYSHPDTKEGLRGTCKSCDLKSSHQWQRANPEKKAAQNRRYRQINPEKCAAADRRKREANPEKYAEIKRRWQQAQCVADPNFRLLRNYRKRIWDALKGNSKSQKTAELIGCTIPQLRLWLVQQFWTGMTLENYGYWHVDHIRPCSSFDLSNPSQQKECFHYSNLQPLWGRDNLIKSDKI